MKCHEMLYEQSLSSEDKPTDFGNPQTFSSTTMWLTVLFFSVSVTAMKFGTNADGAKRMNGLVIA